MQNQIPELWQHQKQCIERAREKDCFALFFQPGCGKTRTLLEIIRDKYNEHGLLKTLIVTPLITLKNWENEFSKFSKVPRNEICLLEGSGQKRLKTFVESRAKIFICAYETLLMSAVYDAFIKWKPSILVFDESHRLKSITAKRTKLAVKLSDIADYRYILTGSPILNSSMDIFSQYRILDGGATFGKNFFAFRAKYFFDKNSGMPAQKHFPLWIQRPDKIEELNNLIAEKSMFVKKEDCLTLPPYIQQTIKVDMSPLQRRLYEEMRKDFITFIKNNDKISASVATLAITKAMRLMQIASGFVKTEDGQEHILKDTPKEKALKELLSDIAPNNKVIIWAVFKQNYEAIRRVLIECDLPFREATGETSAKEKFIAVEDFCSDPSIRVFLSHPGSGGEGINLIPANYSIVFSRTFSLAQEIQSQARNFRAGSSIHSKITRYDLVCENSLEEKIQEALANKKEIGNSLLKQLVLDE